MSVYLQTILSGYKVKLKQPSDVDSRLLFTFGLGRTHKELYTLLLGVIYFVPHTNEQKSVAVNRRGRDIECCITPPRKIAAN